MLFQFITNKQELPIQLIDFQYNKIQRRNTGSYACMNSVSKFYFILIIDKEVGQLGKNVTTSSDINLLPI